MELTSREMMLIKRALAMYGKELFDNIVKDNSATIAQSTLSEVGPLVLKVSRAIRKEEM